MDCGDNGLRHLSHEIFGVIAVQHTQGNYRAPVLGALLVVALLFAAKTAFSAGIADRGQPDPILGGPILNDAPQGPCDPGTAEADLTPGTDVDGHPVAPANLDQGRVPVPGQMMVRLKSGSYVAVDGSKLDPLLNPKPACH
jgi:hypothetical protein